MTRGSASAELTGFVADNRLEIDEKALGLEIDRTKRSNRSGFNEISIEEAEKVVTKQFLGLNVQMGICLVCAHAPLFVCHFLFPILG